MSHSSWGISSGFTDTTFASAGFRDTSAVRMYQQRELDLRRSCMRLLCSRDRTDRSPMEFGLQRFLPHLSRTSVTPILLHMHYVEFDGAAYATNDPEFYNHPEVKRESEPSIQSATLFDNNGWVLPLRYPMTRGMGTRVEVILSTNLLPRAREHPSSLTLMHAEMSDVDGVPPVPAIDLSGLRVTYRVVQYPEYGSERDYEKRRKCQMYVGPCDLYGATSAAGCVTIPLDDLWDDIYCMLKTVYSTMYSANTTPLRQAISDYTAHVESAYQPGGIYSATAHSIHVPRSSIASHR